MKDSPQLISIARTAREANVTVAVVKRLIESGALSPVKLITGRMLVPRAQLDHLLRPEAIQNGHSAEVPA